MRLSIIVPTWNEARGIEVQLQRLAPLRALGHEVIVTDGGSRDATVARAQPLADRVLLAPAGRAVQMNAAAEVATGDVLLFLHADTVLPDGADAAVRDGLESSGCVWGRFDVAIRGRSPMFVCIAALQNLRSRLTGMATGDQGIFCRREVFAAVGGYPPVPLMEDLELSRKLRALTPPLCLPLRVQTSGRRWEKHGVWRTILLMWRLRFAWWLGADPAKLARRYPRHEA